MHHAHPILQFIVRKTLNHVINSVLKKPKVKAERMPPVSRVPPMPPVAPVLPANHGVIRDALKALGYSQKAAIEIVKTLPADVSVEDGLRQALKKPH
jgi:Holliday junction resolvasome RuvABC DNA-binding subunit